MDAQAGGALVGGALSIFVVICYVTSTRFILPRRDLLEYYRRGSFSSGCIIGGILGIFIGFATAFSVSEEPGQLLNKDYIKNDIIILSAILLLGQTIGIVNVLRDEEKNHKAVAGRIKEWKVSRNAQTDNAQ